jgi:hypothetical protein
VSVYTFTYFPSISGIKQCLFHVTCATADGWGQETVPVSHATYVFTLLGRHQLESTASGGRL